MSQTFELTGHAGAPIRMLLRSTPGTGAVWSVSSVTPPAQVTDMGVQDDDSSVGGPATQIFELRAPAPGRYQVTFHLKRVWERGVRSEAKYVIHVGDAE